MSTNQNIPVASQRVSRGSEAVTRGVRVTVWPVYLPRHSNPGENQFVFGYRIRIGNESGASVKLLARHWVIVDAHGRMHEVRGDGVVGLQPVIGPGEAHEYESCCPLATAWGTMEGSYTMVGTDGEEFDVAIARFYLVAPTEPEPMRTPNRRLFLKPQANPESR